MLRFKVVVTNNNPSLLGGLFHRELISKETFASPLEALRRLPEEKQLVRDKAIALFLEEENGRVCSPNLIN